MVIFKRQFLCLMSLVLLIYAISYIPGTIYQDESDEEHVYDNTFSKTSFQWYWEWIVANKEVSDEDVDSMSSGWELTKCDSQFDLYFII